jgi:hypothetical protein
MPNGGHDKVTCIVCGRSWMAINVGWMKGGEPVAVGEPLARDVARYAGRAVGRREVVCFDCQPALPDEKARWLTAGWVPPFTTTRNL